MMGAVMGRGLVGEDHQLAPRRVLGQGQHRLEGARDGGREPGGQVLVQGGVADTWGTHRGQGYSNGGPRAARGTLDHCRMYSEKFQNKIQIQWLKRKSET